MNKHIRAFSLPVVMVVSVLVSLLVLFALSLADLECQEYQVYHTRKQRILDLHSAVARYCIDSNMFYGQGDMVRVKLFDMSASHVVLTRKDWGLYEVLAAKSDYLPLSYTVVCGKARGSDLDAAIWIRDRARPLSLSGNTRIDGQAYVPQSGINYTGVSGEIFYGDYVEQSAMRISSGQLPSIDSSSLNNIQNYRDSISQAWYFRNSQAEYVDHSAPTALLYGKNSDTVYHLGGNQILYGDKLTISADSHLDGIVLVARTIAIEDGFHGCGQFFCTDSLLIGMGVHLSAPSGLFVSGHEHPYIAIGKNSKVEGYVIVLNGGKEDKELLYPSLAQQRGSQISGLVYIDGAAMLAGVVNGSAFLGDCFTQVNGRKCPGVLRDVQFSYDADAVYPKLLKGPYRRREIRKVH